MLLYKYTVLTFCRTTVNVQVTTGVVMLPFPDAYDNGLPAGHKCIIDT